MISVGWTVLVHSRPRFWLYLGGTAAIGAIYGAHHYSAITDPLVVSVLIFFLLPANVFLYGVNDIFDRQIDRLNPKKFDQERRYTGELVVPIAVILCGILGLGLAVLMPPVAAVWLVVFLLLAVAYSAPPVRFKTRPFLDSMSNGLYVIPGIVTYLLVADVYPPIPILIGAWLWTMAMHTFSAIPDIQADSTAGINTLATTLGERWALGYCFLCWLCAAIAFATVDVRLGSALAIYPLIPTGLLVGFSSIRRVYWWFPWLNAGVGMVLTVGGLWVLFHD